MGQKRFAVAFMDVFDGVLRMSIRTAETAFDACVDYLTEEQGFSFSDSVAEDYAGSIDDLSYDHLMDNFINAIEIS